MGIEPKMLAQDNFWDVLGKCVPNILNPKRQRVHAGSWHKLLGATPPTWDALQIQLALLLEQSILAAIEPRESSRRRGARGSTKRTEVTDEGAVGQLSNADVEHDMREWENDAELPSDAQQQR